MSSEDVFERNVANLVRHGALPLDEERSVRARDRFLREESPERLSWKIAAAAAALLVVATIFWSARTGSSIVGRGAPESPVAVDVMPTSGGNDCLKGVLRLPRPGDRAPRLRFEGRSPLPDGLQFKVWVFLREEGFSAGRLEPGSRGNLVGVCELKGNAFDVSWRSPGPLPIRVEVTAPDGLQERDMVKQLKIKESERIWNFAFDAWDGRLLSLLGPQLAELTDLVREVRDLILRVEEACTSEAVFKEKKKGLVSEAERLQARVMGFADNGCYTASGFMAAWTARDLMVSIPIFKWEGGKFVGPHSYYTNDKKGLDHRQMPFEFTPLRKYLDEALVVAGREFDLWILKDIRRGGLQEAHRMLLKEQSKRPGVAEFADRLLEGAAGLEAEVRALPR